MWVDFFFDASFRKESRNFCCPRVLSVIVDCDLICEIEITCHPSENFTAINFLSAIDITRLSKNDSNYFFSVHKKFKTKALKLHAKLSFYSTRQKACQAQGKIF